MSDVRFPAMHLSHFRGVSKDFYRHFPKFSIARSKIRKLFFVLLFNVLEEVGVSVSLLRAPCATLTHTDGDGGLVVFEKVIHDLFVGEGPLMVSHWNK